MRYIAFDVETPNRWNNRMSAIGITVIEDGEIVRSSIPSSRLTRSTRA